MFWAYNEIITKAHIDTSFPFLTYIMVDPILMVIDSETKLK